ncbi:MAG: exodeoxyribonuclease VII large subunit [Alicyclobacillus sp.]|nr:exodeoxyribonuclease VII large subunit [Alicyclobacillus sp.]
MSLTESTPVYTVSQLNALVRGLLEADVRLQRCWVSGEISNLKVHSSGHMYFTLKDEHSRLRAVMFASRNRRLPFRPEDGMRVLAGGSVSVFDRDGQYQLYVEELQPDGIGALYVAFHQLKERLAAEGLFDPQRKRPLPRYPRCIGVVTSPTGAVIRDIVTTLQRRYPLARVVLAPALVQGPGAAPTLVAALARLVRYAQEQAAIDVIIVARGGGSLEELWPFNEEQVVRAVAACPIPVVSAVGHETDVTLCDFAADVRAATPTGAAELVAPHQRDVSLQLQQWAGRAQQAVVWRVGREQQRLAAVLRSSHWRDPLRLVRQRRQSVDYVDNQVQQAMARALSLRVRFWHGYKERLLRLDPRVRLARSSQRLDQLASAAGQPLRARLAAADAQWQRVTALLVALNPLHVLRRGYSAVFRVDNGAVVTSAGQLQPGDDVWLRFADGQVWATIGSRKGGSAGGTRPFREGRTDGGEQLALDLF